MLPIRAFGVAAIPAASAGRAGSCFLEVSMNRTSCMFLVILLGLFAGCGNAIADDVEEGRAAIGARQYEKAMRLLLPKAREGNAVAQNAVGILYRNGWGVRQDHSEALAWFRRAADQGDARGQFNIGRVYESGDGVARDFVQAANWYRKAAEQGYPPAQTLLGAMYARGDGVPQDWGEAMRWYRKAADQGDAVAQSRVGLMHAEGQGTPKDYPAAEQWFRKAAAQQDPAGQTWLGWLYLRGWGVKKDVAEGMKWLRLAADQEAPEAMHTLGALYAEGKEVAPDDISAIMWLRRAGMYRHGEAQQLLQKRFGLKPEQGPLLVHPDQAMASPAESLAAGYLAVSFTARMLEPARTGGFRATIVTKLDGEPHSITAANAALYLAGYQDRLRVYALAISRRGFQEISGPYRTEATASCRRIQSLWAGGIREGALRELNISRDGFKVELVHTVQLEGKTHSVVVPGIVVESAIALVDPGNSDFLFLGQIRPGQITVRPDAKVLAGWPSWANPPSEKDLSECVVTLHAP